MQAFAEAFEIDAEDLEALAQVPDINIEERIAKEAAERATREAEEKALREKAEAERKIAEEKAAAEKRELELTLAKERAEREAKEAAENERKRIEAEALAAQKAEEARQADLTNQKRIHGAIIEWFTVRGVSDDIAKAFIIAARKGDVPNIKIVY